MTICLELSENTKHDLIHAMSSMNLSSKNTCAIVKIQSIVRMYLKYKFMLIPSALYQTKIWRQQRSWYATGKSNECEIYQIRMIEQIIHQKWVKTQDRIHMRKLLISPKKYPMRYDDGFEYTETFDGIQYANNKTIYYNLKFVCGAGGAQTRTLREVYHFIESQLKLLLESDDPNIYFVNILDGNESYKAMSKFNYLLTNKQYTKIKKNIFIGDLASFQIYYSSFSSLSI